MRTNNATANRRAEILTLTAKYKTANQLVWSTECIRIAGTATMKRYRIIDNLRSRLSRKSIAWYEMAYNLINNITK